MFKFYLIQEHPAVYTKASNLQQALCNYEKKIVKKHLMAISDFQTQLTRN